MGEFATIPNGEQRTSLLKMGKQPPERKIAALRAVFPYRGDKILYSVDRGITVKYALDVMEIANKFSGYRLQWTVKWAED